MGAKFYKSWWLAAILLVAAGGVIAWRYEGRSSMRREAETKARIQDDARKSIGSSMGGFKMCPLSDPNCKPGPQ